jgi:hypothetical protein
MLRSRSPSVILVLILVPLASAAPASASFHLNKIREVAPETSPGAKDAFVELQMYAQGQNFVSAHTIDFWDAAGSVKHNRALLGPDPPNGGNQRTILIGDDNTAGADFKVNNLSSEISAAGGAVCYDFSKVDCVAWGSFNNAGTQMDLPLPVGSNEAAIPAGMSITRSIAAGCPTLLEAADDTNDSNADFSPTPRTPRPNATAPTERACGGGSDRDPPQTTIRRRPPQRTTDRTPTFRFRSDEAHSSFQCKLDGKRYKKCSSPLTTSRLSFGTHTLRVRAIDRAGNRDRTPAVDTFRVVRH